MVRSSDGGRPVFETGGVAADLIADKGRHPRLVMGDPMLHSVAQITADNVSILDEGFGGGPGGPAALILKNLGQVPMVEGDERSNARG